MEELKKVLSLLIVMGFIIRVVTARKISNFESIFLMVAVLIALMFGFELM